jgi:hypothetical protein
MKYLEAIVGALIFVLVAYGLSVTLFGLWLLSYA